MAKTLSLLIPGEPVPMLRARTGKGRWYTPKKCEEQMELIRMLWQIDVRDRFNGKVPLEMDAVFIFERAPSTIKKDGTLRSKAHRQHVIKPDWDNCMKLVCDALNPKDGFLGAYDDDSQIIRPGKRSGKYFTDAVVGVDEACTFIALRQIPDMSGVVL